MSVEVKFCGLTRPEDALEAARLGASYVGAIFAGGPRLVSAQQAAANFAPLPPGVRRVGVFADQRIEEIRAVVERAALDIVQLHADPTASDVRAVQDATGAQVWAVCRIEGTTLPAEARDLADATGTLVLDAKVAGVLGGSGRALAWHELAGAVDELRDLVSCRIVLAGGLAPDTVSTAVAVLRPEVVDVSSGVERAPGIKDHERMRAFMSAVQRTGATR